MRKLIATALILGGCISKGTDVPPVSAGDGLTVKDQVLSIDPSKVPLLPPDCGPNQVVVKGSAGTFICAAAAANAQSLGGKPADSYALKTDTVANANTLGSHPASDFLGATAQAVDSAMFGGKPTSSYAAATAGVANNSAQLGGLAPSNFAAATNGVANSALDSAGLGGKPPASYAAATNGVANNSLQLGGLPASAFAAGTGGAANNSLQLGGLPPASFAAATNGVANSSLDSAQLGGKPPASYAAATNGVANNSTQLNGLPSSAFATACGATTKGCTPGTAANSLQLNGQPSTSYATAIAGVANNSLQLNGQPSTSYATAIAGVANNSNQLGGVGASSYFRNDTNNQKVPLPLTVGDPAGTRIVLGANGVNDIFGSEFGTGNLYIESDSAGTDSRIYLNKFSGKGVAFGNGTGGVVASVDPTGKMTAASLSVDPGGSVSLSGMQLFRRDATASGLNAALNCNQICANTGPAATITNPGPSATCVSARYSNVTNPEYGAACTDFIQNGGNTGPMNAKCYCTTF